MSPNPQAGPIIGSNGHVPWHVYLADREQLHGRLDRFEGKLDHLGEILQAIAREEARHDGQEVAQEAADLAVQGGRKDRAERLWDLGRTLLVAVLGVVGTLVTHSLLT